eukprot:7053751-Alexandrium_andersonii.AAC.1
MSASLVGSEMCIRDSPPPSVPDAGGATRSAAPLASGPAEWGSPDVRPVSYTHLTLPTICSV